MITDERLDHALRDWHLIEGSQRAPEALLEAVLDGTRGVAPRRRWSIGAIPRPFGVGAVAMVAAALVLFGVVWRLPSADDGIGARVSGPIDVTFRVSGCGRVLCNRGTHWARLVCGPDQSRGRWFVHHPPNAPFRGWNHRGGDVGPEHYRDGDL
jgi:hypothetical protein